MMNDSARGLRRVAATLGVPAVVMTLVIVAALGVSGALSAAMAETAPATITQPDALTALNSGGSATQWTIKLPANSHCSGDTSTQGFLVYSYITAADPGTLSFTPNGPSTGFALFDTGGNPWINQSTAIGSGNLAQPPTFDYLLFSTDGSGGNANVLPPGTYNVGIACATQTGVLDQFWNVQVVFSADAADPSGEVWAVAAAPPPTTTTTSTSTSTSTSSTSTTSTTVGGGGTTTTTSSTSTTSTTSTLVPVATAQTAGGHLAATGTAVMHLSDWAVIMIIVGLAAVFFAGRRRPQDRRP